MPTSAPGSNPGGGSSSSSNSNEQQGTIQTPAQRAAAQGPAPVYASNGGSGISVSGGSSLASAPAPATTTTVSAPKSALTTGEGGTLRPSTLIENYPAGSNAAQYLSSLMLTGRTVNLNNLNNAIQEDINQGSATGNPKTGAVYGTQAPTSQTTSTSFSNGIDYATFGKNAAPTIVFSDLQGQTNEFVGSYQLAGQTVYFTGTLPTTTGYASNQAKLNAAVDYAYNALNQLQLSPLPKNAVNAQAWDVNLDQFGIPGTNPITGGSYQVPVAASLPTPAPGPVNGSTPYTSGYTVYGVPLTPTQTTAVNNFQSNYAPFASSNAAIDA